MNRTTQTIYLGNTPQKQTNANVEGEYVTLLSETFYKIKNFDALEPFFMSVVSSFDHWLFISSSGGLSAGRVNAEHALFPYYTEDKITENSENTGSKTILLISRDKTYLWEPFSQRQLGQYAIERNLYKNFPGTALVFEEINHTLGLTFRYAWRTGDRFGFIKTNWLTNFGDSTCHIEVLDGLQNILPAHVTSQTQNTFSSLLDAYKRSELQENGLGLFALNSTLTDLAEPSESLLTTTVFQVGLDHTNYLLSSMQLNQFRTGECVVQETESRGRRGAYFVHSSFALPSGNESKWHLVAEVDQDSVAIVRLLDLLKNHRHSLDVQIEHDIQANTARLQSIVANADGLQTSADPLCTAHHFANVMFNVMRGGTFANHYWIDKKDFTDFVTTHHREVVPSHKDFFDKLPEKIHLSELLSQAEKQESADLIRLSYTYLPLTFSRRHGDPSRPWNRFNINIKKADGSQKLDYEGNWRDIFQNWEALAYSYPEYVEGMIFTFLSATTTDGYNPYRITRAGLDWEIPEPANLWANIGYWSDHQIIYLLKLMEISTRVHPGKLRANLERPILSYADIPYRIKPYADVQKDPYNTIRFDYELQNKIEKRVDTRGTDGKLLVDVNGAVLHRSLAEKLLTLLLAKLVNFVPEGGIWMNTQRPEWNDANNALVGKGLSVVTLGYLRRYMVFCRSLLNHETPEFIQVSTEVVNLFLQVVDILKNFEGCLAGSFSDEQRRLMTNDLGQAGSDYRWNLYTNGFSGKSSKISGAELLEFFDTAQAYVEQSLRANRRADHLYHAYNILHLQENCTGIGHLYEMLEGQVSILSSGMLSGEESLALLKSLRSSALYRPDQNSYILYPDKTLPGLLDKNSLSAEQIGDLRLPSAVGEAGDMALLIRDEHGVYHFSGQLRNAKDVRRALDGLRTQPQFAELVSEEGEKIAALFETIFRHNEFTGRSGTFFAYEGLGSIYWHMVSKLLLAVQETLLRCQGEPVAVDLIASYRDIRDGLGFHKSPAGYGAFPTDPYSHTPKGQGARQPGMTGMVKEEIITRLAEVAITIEDGCIVFNPLLLDAAEVLTIPSAFVYQDIARKQQQIDVPAGSLAVTFCQVPVIVQCAAQAEICIHFTDGITQSIRGSRLDAITSRRVFQRDESIDHLLVHVQNG